MFPFRDHSSFQEGCCGSVGFPGAGEEGKAWNPSFELAWFLESLFDPVPSPDTEGNRISDVFKQVT